MSSPQEGRYTKIGSIATVLALGIAIFAWRCPAELGLSTRETGENVYLPQNSTNSETSTTGLPQPAPADTEPTTSEPSPKPAPSPAPTRLARSCGTPQNLTLRVGASVKVAEGLAVLSLRPGPIGSEKILTVGISTDRETRSEAVLGAPRPFRFDTSLGGYYANVTEVDFESNSMELQVGCKDGGKSP